MFLNPNISKTGSHSIINNTIFWKYVAKTFRCIYVNCFDIFGFLAEVNTNLQKMHFLDNSRTITREWNIETREMTPFFPLLFLFCLTVKFISKFENSQKFTFMKSQLWLILVCKISRTAHHAFLGKRHPEVT